MEEPEFLRIYAKIHDKKQVAWRRNILEKETNARNWLYRRLKSIQEKKEKTEYYESPSSSWPSLTNLCISWLALFFDEPSSLINLITDFGHHLSFQSIQEEGYRYHLSNAIISHDEETWSSPKRVFIPRVHSFSKTKGSHPDIDRKSIVSDASSWFMSSSSCSSSYRQQHPLISRKCLLPFSCYSFHYMIQRFCWQLCLISHYVLLFCFRYDMLKQFGNLYYCAIDLHFTPFIEMSSSHEVMRHSCVG